MGFFGNYPPSDLGQVPGMGGIMAALANNAMTPPQGGGNGNPPGKKKHRSLRGIAGIVGDALLAASGRPPLYAPMQMQQQEWQHEQNKPYRFQNNNGDVIEVNPATGEQRVMYQDTPKPNVPNIAEVNDWYWNLPEEERAKAEKVMRLMNPGAFTPPTPVVMEPGDVLQGGGGAGQPISKEQYDALPPGAEYQAPDGTWKRKGGAAPSSGPATFPGPY